MLKAVILSALFLKVLATKIYFSNVITSFDSNYTNFTAVISKDRVSINGTIVSFYDLSKMTVSHMTCAKNDSIIIFGMISDDFHIFDTQK